MNAATRAQAADILTWLLSPARPVRPHTLARARRVLKAAAARPAHRLPARACNLADPNPCARCQGIPTECRACGCPHLKKPDPLGGTYAPADGLSYDD